MLRSVLLLFLVASLCSAADGSVARDGFRLYYQTEGAGRPVVMLSGGPGIEVEYMKEVAPAFGEGFQFIYLEQRGTGRSRPPKLTPANMTVDWMVEDLEALRQHLKIDRLFLAGHSWGGMLAMAYGARYPNSVDRMVLIDSGGPTNEFETWFGDNIASRMRPEDDSSQKQMFKDWSPDKAFIESVRAMTPAYFFDRAKGLAFKSKLKDGDLHPDALRLLSADRQKSYDLRPGLRNLRVPVLIVHGHQDPIGQKTAEDIHGLIANSTLRYIRRSGHFPWLEQPEEFRKIITEFLQPR